jgi:hypothetical protein
MIGEPVSGIRSPSATDHKAASCLTAPGVEQNAAPSGLYAGIFILCHRPKSSALMYPIILMDQALHSQD